jgi:hypothetical protein
MNDKWENADLKRRLEQATSPRHCDDVRLDAQTAAWREDWLALGQLLDSSFPPAEAMMPPMPSPWRSSGRRLWLLGGAMAAIAAAVLVFLGVTRLGRDVDWIADAPAPASGVDGPSAPGQAPSEARQSSSRLAARSELSKTELAWDDPLDDELTTLRQAVAAVRIEWHSPSDRTVGVGLGLAELEKDMKDPL